MTSCLLSCGLRPCQKRVFSKWLFSKKKGFAPLGSEKRVHSKGKNLIELPPFLLKSLWHVNDQCSI